ncbi:MAG: CAP domain-containing protein [Deltaproteobacteria bacterium]|nr:CAP domain-containing protein [Deltaproteobacteria bacterium]
MRRSIALALLLFAGCAPRKKMEVYTPPPLSPAPSAAPTETAAAPAPAPPALPSPDIVLGPALTPHGLVLPPAWGMPPMPVGLPTPGPGALPFPIPSVFPFPTATAPAPTSTAAPPAPSPSSWSPASAAMEDRVLALVNQHRATGAICGSKSFGPAPPLGLEPALQKAARGHSQDMATKDYFSHDAPDGRRPQDRMKAAGFFGSYSGENIAAGNETADLTVAQWMKSPGHCENIMDKDFKVLGVGYFGNPSAKYKHYWTQNFGG